MKDCATLALSFKVTPGLAAPVLSVILTKLLRSVVEAMGSVIGWLSETVMPLRPLATKLGTVQGGDPALKAVVMESALSAIMNEPSEPDG